MTLKLVGRALRLPVDITTTVVRRATRLADLGVRRAAGLVPGASAPAHPPVAVTPDTAPAPTRIRTPARTPAPTPAPSSRKIAGDPVAASAAKAPAAAKKTPAAAKKTPAAAKKAPAAARKAPAAAKASAAAKAPAPAKKAAKPPAPKPAPVRPAAEELADDKPVNIVEQLGLDPAPVDRPTS